MMVSFCFPEHARARFKLYLYAAGFTLNFS
jgi:hypothetical protein